MHDNLHIVWDKFFEGRTKSVWERFPGSYRAVVVETNDPLQMGRVRFKCPDWHDYDLAEEDCPWAVPCVDLGGKRAGRWASPCKGDWVWITLERQHPYGPIWTGFATPTRRKFYPLARVAGRTPVPVDDQGRPQPPPSDYNLEYLPRDGRPMSHGWQDRYGNLELHSAIGYFPSEHASSPPPPGHDAIQGAAFEQQAEEPKVNQPDLKYSVRLTKGGQFLLLGDQGYYWKKQPTQPNLGEFEGDAEKDDEFELRRWKYLQKLINEGRPDSSVDGKPIRFGDQRRIELKDRYGSRLELRSVGWAQRGPVESKTRDGEYGPPRIVSLEEENDFRWVKLRTKGGWLLQAYDKGFHPQEDKFIKRKLLDECGHLSEREDIHWKDKDARWFRICGRHGYKLVLDERGSDAREADQKELPRGNGFLLKGRRSPAAHMKEKKGNPRGFYLEFNENDALNHMTLGSPLGAVVELNDRYEYMVLATSLGKGYATKWRGLKENEFLLQPTMLRYPEFQAYHLKLDHENEYFRLKTRGGQGPKPDHVVNPTGIEKFIGSDGKEYYELHQGIEARDGSKGDGPWVEMVDCQHRGFWFCKRRGLGIWRGKMGSFMYQWIDDQNKVLALYNDNEAGRLHLYCRGSIEIFGAANVTVHAFGALNLKSGGPLTLEGGGAAMSLSGGKIVCSTLPEEGSVGGVAGLERPEAPDPIEPTDRAVTYNGPFEQCPVEEVEHPIGG